MGVSHLSNWASKAGSNKAAGGKDSTTSTSTHFGNPAATSGSTHVPSGSGHGFSDSALRTGAHPGQPPKGNSNGGRAGSKSGQPKVGGSGGRPGMSGGRMN